MALQFIRSRPTSDPIAQAFGVLAQQEEEVVKRLETLQVRLERIRHAMEAMRPLLPDAPVQTADENEEEDDEVAVGADNPFAGLRFAQALGKYMEGKPPSTTTEITRGFEAAGWAFKQPLASSRVNQVGVTMRRFKGKLFESDAEGKLWSVI